jgi:hypothetical protein
MGKTHVERLERKGGRWYAQKILGGLPVGGLDVTSE